MMGTCQHYRSVLFVPALFLNLRGHMGETWRLKMADEAEQSFTEESFLFPIVSANNEDKRDAKETKPLFPSVSVRNSEEKERPDWLYNDSYKETLVEDVPAFGVSTEKETPKLGKAPGPDNYNAGESLSSDDDQPSKRAKQKRKHDKRQKPKKHKKRKHKSRKNHNEKLKAKEEEQLMKLPSTIWIEESGLQLEKAFRIHKKPDHDNCSFGGLYRLDVALHKKHPKLKCLGLRADQVLDIGPKNKKGRRTESQQRYWGRESLSMSESSLIPCQQGSTSGTSAGKSSCGFSKNFAYVPLELPSAGATTSVGETPSGENQMVSNELTTKTKDFNQQVRKDPSDVEAWLALAELQDEHVQFGDNLTSHSLNKLGRDELKKTSKISLDKKLAVLEQAVEKNPTSVDLIIAYMNLRVEIGSNDKIADNWRDILFNQPEKTLLWKHYLMFCQSNFSSFSVSDTLAIYSKCFGTLSAINDGIFKSHSPEEDTEVGMVEIFVQFCQFLKQTGHSEKAVAAFQAIVEFNCFHPKSLDEKHSTASAVSFFETFWDSDVPRFGENDACGWDSWMENNSSSSTGSNRIPVNEIFSMTVDGNQRKTNSAKQQERVISAGLGKAVTWVELEGSRETELWQPKKTSAEVDDDEDRQEELDGDDPDRVVFFQDINSCLFTISQETLKFQLVAFFLTILGVPTEFRSFDTHDVRLQSLWQVLLEDDKQFGGYSDSRCGSRFSCASWTKLKSETADATRDSCPTPALRTTFIRNVFNQALRAFSGELQAMLVVNWLGFEKDLLLSETNSKQRKQCYKAVRKLAKSLLKLEHCCNNLKVWMAFVEVEWAFGNTDEARRIVSSSLEQSQRALTSEDQNLKFIHYSFVRSYCEMEMGLQRSIDETTEKIDLVNDERKNRILRTISVLVENGSSSESAVTPSRILKMHRALQEMSSRMLTDQKWNSEDTRSGQSLADFMMCYTLFQYWSLGMDAARSVLDSLLSAFAFDTSAGDSAKLSGSKYHEEILVFYCRLLQFHARHGVCPVKPLRDLLLLALSTFQENRFFLHSFVTLELKSCASYSTRRFFDKVLPKSQTPVPWLYAILFERRRQKTIWSATQVSQNPKVLKNSLPPVVQVPPKTGVDHRLRSLYERAILHPSARHCVALWRSYMDFEAENGDLRQAKAIFYQSLQCCAWAKVLYSHAIKIFPDSLQDLHDLMEEKELRIRVPIDELDLLLET